MRNVEHFIKLYFGIGFVDEVKHQRQIMYFEEKPETQVVTSDLKLSQLFSIKTAFSPLLVKLHLYSANIIIIFS